MGGWRGDGGDADAGGLSGEAVELIPGIGEDGVVGVAGYPCEPLKGVALEPDTPDTKEGPAGSPNGVVLIRV